MTKAEKTSPESERVIIAGAGIAGLTLALSLEQQGIPFRVYEAVSELRPLGVGINLQPHAVREIFELGLAKEIDAIGLKTEEVAYFSAQGGLIWREPRGKFAGYNWPQYSIHRGKLQMMLRDALVARAGEEVLVLGAALESWQETEAGIEVKFVDRHSGKALTSVKGGLLVAGDGINSAARARLYPDEGPAHWRGTMMWRGVSKGPRFRTGRTMAMAGTWDRKFVCYPIADAEGGQSVINWIADLAKPADYRWNKQDWNRVGKLEDVLPPFADWQFDWLDVPEIIRTAELIYEYPMVDRNPLTRWTHGRMTLIGDAAHAMYPIGSNGASQAIIDARVLTRELRDHGVTGGALEAYDLARREKVNAVVLANRGDGPDKVLDLVAERAPNGFEVIDEVMSQQELTDLAASYKKLAGMDISTLNNQPSIL
ncbi:MAG: flavin-dependent oxidoreductase [Trueperaceae bacterium]|nr:flavin-dependent oxidoreductase [Trueperaceae bacterium]